MFPIFDIRGNVIGFEDASSTTLLPKYMNSRKLSCITKRKHLYALNFAKIMKVKA